MKFVATLITILLLFLAGSLTFVFKVTQKRDEAISLVTLYSQSGEILKTYKAKGFVRTSRSGIIFEQLETGKTVKLSGTYTVE
jgi:hypothetical protein